MKSGCFLALFPVGQVSIMSLTYYRAFLRPWAWYGVGIDLPHCTKLLFGFSIFDLVRKLDVLTARKHVKGAWTVLHYQATDHIISAMDFVLLIYLALSVEFEKSKAAVPSTTCNNFIVSDAGRTFKIMQPHQNKNSVVAWNMYVSDDDKLFSMQEHFIVLANFSWWLLFYLRRSPLTINGVALLQRLLHFH